MDSQQVPPQLSTDVPEGWWVLGTMACGVYQYTAKAGCKREKPPSKSIYPPGKESISDPLEKNK